MRKNTLLIPFLALATAVFPIQTEGKKSASYSARGDRTQEKSKKTKVGMKETPGTKEQPIKIIGDDEFIKKTEEALTLIREKSPRSYAIVTNYIAIIRSGYQSGIDARVTPPTYYVGLSTVQSQLPWYASTIVHDSYHSKLYHDYRKKNGKQVPHDVWRGRAAENDCLSAQEDFLKDVEAPTRFINHIKRMKYADYFSSRARAW